MSTALIPGSFDPMTVGHLDIVKRAAEVFDKVVLAVMINENKNYLFTIDQRRKIAELSVSDIENVTVLSSTGWLYELFDEVDADAIVKGVRNADDLAYESSMANFNISKNPGAHTLYLLASPGLENVSSTAFRNTADMKIGIDKYICEGARGYVSEILNKKH